MRVALAFLALLLTEATLHSEASEELPVAENKHTCCLSYTSRAIPLRLVKGYDITSNLCRTPAVIFITKHERMVCANPSEAWVQRYIRHLDNKSK